MTGLPHSVRRAIALVLASLVVALAATPVAAQRGARPARDAGWSAVRVTKWALLGAAVALGGYALANSRRASAAYGDLQRLCDADASMCRLAGGRYTNASAEQLYRTTVSNDRRARVGILGGHAALLGSAALFVADLRKPRAPADIPLPLPGTSAAPSAASSTATSAAIRVSAP